MYNKCKTINRGFNSLNLSIDRYSKTVNDSFNSIHNSLDRISNTNADISENLQRTSETLDRIIEKENDILDNSIIFNDKLKNIRKGVVHFNIFLVSATLIPIAGFATWLFFNKLK